MTEGEQLRKQIKLGSKTVDKIAKESGISRGQMYLLFKEAEISDFYRNKLKKAGVILGKTNDPRSVLEVENKALKREIELLKKLLSLHESKQSK